MASESKTVRDVMTGALVTVEPGATPARAAGTMERHGIRQLVVLDEAGGLRGMLSYRDLLRLVGVPEQSSAATVAGLMDPAPPTFHPDTPLLEAVRAMVAGEVSAAAVVEGDRVVGVLSEHDVLGLTGRLLADAGW